MRANQVGVQRYIDRCIGATHLELSAYRLHGGCMCTRRRFGVANDIIASSEPLTLLLIVAANEKLLSGRLNSHHPPLNLQVTTDSKGLSDNNQSTN
jgi:hypothetical protein